MRLIALPLILAALAAPVQPAPKGCPPGLAKKDPGCVPPGLAKKGYRVGERIDSDYILIRDPGRYDLDPDKTYYRVGDTIYRVDRDTRAVLDIIGGIATLLN